jgi:hypothetical protein
VFLCSHEDGVVGASQKHATAKRAGGDAAKSCYRAAIALNRTGSTTHMYPTYPNFQDARDLQNRLRRIPPLREAE